MIKRRFTSTQKHTNKYFMKRPKPINILYTQLVDEGETTRREPNSSG